MAKIIDTHDNLLQPMRCLFPDFNNATPYSFSHYTKCLLICRFALRSLRKTFALFAVRKIFNRKSTQRWIRKERKGKSYKMFTHAALLALFAVRKIRPARRRYLSTEY
ncbi:MAG: hypothetical protein LBH84_08110 [Prevotellaceae bacterium]|nr:hypothetical protein [Prevotellaceae bacterium]